MLGGEPGAEMGHQRGMSSTGAAGEGRGWIGTTLSGRQNPRGSGLLGDSPPGPVVAATIRYHRNRPRGSEALDLPRRDGAEEFRLVRGLMSPTSSRKSVPPSAASSWPRFDLNRAGERTLLVSEESALHQIPGERGAIHLTNGPCARALPLWIARATSSLPAPLSPVMRTFVSVRATLAISARTVSSRPPALFQSSRRPRRRSRGAAGFRAGVPGPPGASTSHGADPVQTASRPNWWCRTGPL